MITVKNKRRNYYGIRTFEESNRWRYSSGRKAAQELKNKIIQEAVMRGASVQRITTNLTSEETETLIHINSDGSCIIDSTLSKDITKLINRGYEIIGVTYGINGNVIGLTCKASANNISFRNCK